ncbi:MAG: NAD(P)H-dependent glycerol-3-phosphate dehydrogenase [Actinomycetota bacterium]
MSSTGSAGGALRVGVVGAGSWGTTVASLTAMNAPTTLWARRSHTADAINSTHRNPEYLGDLQINEAVIATASLMECVGTADVVVMAVPSHGFREVLGNAAAHVRPGVPIVSLSKGLEAGTLARMTEVVRSVLPHHPVAVLTGPNLAREIAGGQPAASVIATTDASMGATLQSLFATPMFRVYTNPDIVGCEIAGVVKNVIAIAAGIARGMGFGENTLATLITRGLAEISRLAMAMGAKPLTLAGLAGMGDLIATCSSTQSRNMSVGMRLGRGETLEQITASMNMVAEGVKSSPSVLELASRHGVSMPITEQVVSVCRDGVSAADALIKLMTRSSKSEFE